MRKDKKKIKRCPWVKEGDRLYEEYHDKEWGVPVYDDRKILEFLILESAQAGLSWRTILGRREGYERAFANFDFKKVAKFDVRDVARLMKDEKIIRNRLKIESAINNAKRFLEVRSEFGTFSKYAWSFKNAEIWAKDLKKRGFKFLGPTTLYAHMQATGMVNDHTTDCFRYRELK